MQVDELHIDAYDGGDDVYFNKLQWKVSQNLYSTWTMQTSQYGISKENRPTNIKLWI
jgi:hypothetical protein